MTTVYAVASAKGGVGKTTTTAAVSTHLADAGEDVVVIDADIGMANLAGALGINAGETTIHDVLAGRAEPEEAVHPGPKGMRVLPGETDLDAYAEADPDGLQDVIEAFDDTDYLLVDAGAGLSHDSALPLGIADETLLVSTPDREALRDTRKTGDLAERLGGSVAGAAITRVDPDDPPENDGPIAEQISESILGRIPEDDAVPAAVKADKPLCTFAPTAPATRAYRSLTTELTGVEVPKPDPEALETDAEEDEGESDVAAAEIGGDAENEEPGDDTEGDGGDGEAETEQEAGIEENTGSMTAPIAEAEPMGSDGSTDDLDGSDGAETPSGIDKSDDSEKTGTPDEEPESVPFRTNSSEGDEGTNDPDRRAQSTGGIEEAEEIGEEERSNASETTNDGSENGEEPKATSENERGKSESDEKPRAEPERDDAENEGDDAENGKTERKGFFSRLLGR
ncbi:P-loop NTPase [Halopenitus sp. H-Gu1]|uniref:MinD/ParA family ATP-binding protein n=1 Tax=Halopenitus sp. H-Gu1 TaxID=3242697 RepID=UPI00359CFF47